MRVFLECSATYKFDTQSGIPRVVRNIINTSAAIGNELGLACQPMVHIEDRGFFPVAGLPSPDRIGRSVRPGQWLRQILIPPLRRTGLLTMVQRGLSLSRALARQVRRLSPQRGPAPIAFQPGDVILLLDSSWTADYWPYLKSAQNAGAKVGVLVYDLIPMMQPEFIDDRTTRCFTRWWHDVCRTADFVECISETICREVTDWLKQHPVPRQRGALECGWVHLGCDLDGDSPGGEVRPELRQALDGKAPAFLMVGSVNPRKNHLFAIDAFERLWAEGSEARLVIVGNDGWMTEDFRGRVRGHSEWNRRLFWFKKVTDAELDFAYRNAKALLTASQAEGFNLPIVEALQRGCRVLASDLSVHREVGGRWAKYFSLSSPESLSRLLRDEALGSEAPVSSEFSWPTWQRSCRDLLAKLKRFERQQPARRPQAA